MSARLHHIREHPSGGWAAGAEENVLRVGLLNNMPDSALERTERQFGRLLGASVPELPIRWYLFTLRSIPRSTEGNLHLLRQYYGGLGDLFGTELDAVIVTGTEPQQPDLRREPYWSELAALFDWIEDQRCPALFSCLAAHAAALHFDGIERQRLAEKRFGMFEHAAVNPHALTASLREPVCVAHSRWHELPAEALRGAGYRILTCTQGGGVDLFLSRGRDDLLFHQGHPEYEADTLAREYRRDVRRFLAGCTERYPGFPGNYFDADEHGVLSAFRERALGERDERLMDIFPLITGRGKQDSSPMARVIGAWLRHIGRTKAERSGAVFAIREEPTARAS